MKKFIIKGGRKLKGRVQVSGSKNATLPIMAASILSNESSSITGIPLVRDIKTMAELLKILGADVRIEGRNMAIIPEGINNFKAPYELVKTMRASYYVLGPLITKYGQAKVSLPGGCAIGVRPIDLHIMGMKKLGAKIELKHGYVVATAKRLKGATIVFDKVSLGATVNVMMAATLAQGATVLKNASKEPEVIETVNFLNAMGAKIEGMGTDTLTITGVDKLHGVKDYKVIPDRIEAATLIAAAVITKGDVIIEGLKADQLTVFFEKLKETGAKFELQGDSVHVRPYKGQLQAVDIKTEPYPGFPTDIQAQWMALMALAEGDTVVTENIWENRFMHVQELVRMGADIKVDNSTAIVSGVKQMSGADVMASDLRASAALILAGLAADGVTEVRRVYHLERGYEELEKKLQSLGADIKVESEDGL